MEKALQIVWIAIVLLLIFLSCYFIGKLAGKKWPIAVGDGPLLRFISICVVGWLIELAVFQVLCVPMVLCNMRFSFLSNVYTLTIGGLCLISLGVCRKELLRFGKYGITPPRKLSKYRITALCLVSLQCILCFLLTEVYEDGIFDYSLAAHTLNHDTMYRTYAYTGYDCSLSFYADRLINSWYMYRAFLAKIMHFHPTMVGRTILPPILLLLSYISYYLLGKHLFQEGEKADVFIIFLSAVNIFGFLRLTPMVMLLTQTANGKTIFVNVLLPLTFLSILKLYDNTEDRKQYLFLALLNLCAASMSTTAVVYGAIITLLLLAVIAFFKRKPSMILLSLLTVVPNGIYILLYLLERKWELWA